MPAMTRASWEQVATDKRQEYLSNASKTVPILQTVAHPQTPPVCSVGGSLHGQPRSPLKEQ